jgi:hypothetical protein
MIYKSYNFVESYSNADGSKRNAIVLNELGKIVRTQPSAVISALKDAEIKVPRRASRRDLTRLIVANKRNRKLAENLAILIVANSTAPNGVLPSGREKFDNLIDPSGGNPTMGPQTQAEAQASAQQYGVGPTAQTNQERAGNFFKNIGDFFRGRQEAKANKPKNAPDGTPIPSNWERFQSWFNRNRGTIGQVAQTTYDSLQTSGKIPTGAGFGNDDGNNNQNTQTTWLERNKTIAVIGAVAIVGGIIYFTTMRKGKGK